MVAAYRRGPRLSHGIRAMHLVLMLLLLSGARICVVRGRMRGFLKEEEQAGLQEGRNEMER